MSLAIAALRIATVKTLDNATSAGDRVFDSVVDPRDLLDKEAAPAICVYADAGKRKLEGRALFDSPNYVDLTIDLFIARAKKVKVTNGEDTFEFEFAAADAAYDNYLRCLSYEVDKALLGEQSLWANLWRLAYVRAAEGEFSEWSRGADASKGARFAFLRGVYRVEAIGDPVPGEPLTAFWQSFFDALEADSEFTDSAGKNLGAYMRKLVTTPSVPSWRAAQTELGLIDGAPAAIGIGDAIDPPGDSEPAPASEISIEDKDRAALLVAADQSSEIVLPIEG